MHSAAAAAATAAAAAAAATTAAAAAAATASSSNLKATSYPVANSGLIGLCALRGRLRLARSCTARHGSRPRRSNVHYWLRPRY